MENWLVISDVNKHMHKTVPVRKGCFIGQVILSLSKVKLSVSQLMTICISILKANSWMHLINCQKRVS